MANLLGNMLTLQTTYHIPMRMDLSAKDLITYYKAWTLDFSESEGDKILSEVIKDLEIKYQKQIEELENA